MKTAAQAELVRPEVMKTAAQAELVRPEAMRAAAQAEPGRPETMKSWGKDGRRKKDSKNKKTETGNSQRLKEKICKNSE